MEDRCHTDMPLTQESVRVCVCAPTWSGVVASIYNPSTWDFETKGSLL